MIELRQRSSSSRNSVGYQRLSLDEDELDIDEEEDVPLLNRSVPISHPVESSSCTFLLFFTVYYRNILHKIITGMNITVFILHSI